MDSHEPGLPRLLRVILIVILLRIVIGIIIINIVIIEHRRASQGSCLDSSGRPECGLNSLGLGLNSYVTPPTPTNQRRETQASLRPPAPWGARVRVLPFESTSLQQAGVFGF